MLNLVRLILTTFKSGGGQLRVVFSFLFFFFCLAFQKVESPAAAAFLNLLLMLRVTPFGTNLVTL